MKNLIDIILPKEVEWFRIINYDIFIYSNCPAESRHRWQWVNKMCTQDLLWSFQYKQTLAVSISFIETSTYNAMKCTPIQPFFGSLRS